MVFLASKASKSTPVPTWGLVKKDIDDGRPLIGTVVSGSS